MYGTTPSASLSSSKTKELKNVNEKAPLLASKKEGFGNTYPAAESNCFSKLFFSWLNPILELGNTRPLEFEDLYQLNPENRADYVYARFEKAWKHEKETHASPKIVRALAYAFGRPFVYAGLLKFLHDILVFVAPMVIQGVITFLNDPTAPMSQGYMYVVIVLVSGIIQSFALRQYFYFCYLVGMRLRSAVVTAVYQKTMRLSAAARQRTSAGEITNLMSVDAQRLQDATPYLHGLWYGFLQIGISIYLLWQQLGASCLAGTAIIIVTIPITGMIARLMRTLQQKLMKVKDERLKICYDVLGGMKVIKLQAWEDSFLERVMHYREEEIRKLRTYIVARASSATIFNAIPSLVAVASFVSYVMSGHVLDVSTALTSLALFNILRFPLFMLPQVINNAVEATVSFKRLTDFLLEEERDYVGEGDLTDVGIKVEDADFKWTTSTKETPTSPTNGGVADSKNNEVKEPFSGMFNVSLTAKTGDLIAVIGHVGSGKSTLLQSILGETVVTRGKLATKGSIAYVSQQPFVQNATVKDNILFGKPFDNAKYLRAIEVSALLEDLKILPAGDLTDIGEKGITLSGGQRTRVGIARAVYQDADIYLFDDPLAAVDGHVGRHIFDRCILNALSNKCRILVTNGLTYLPKCDTILILEKGIVVEEGKYETLRKVNRLASLLKVDADAGTDIQENEEENTSEEKIVHKTESQVGLKRTESSLLEKKRLMTEEERSTGDVKLEMYYVWIRAAGGFCIAWLLLLAFIATQGINLATTGWLSWWSEYATVDTQMYYLYVYTALQGGYAVGVYLQSLFLYISGIHASRKLFRGLLETIMRSPMSFFDTTPMGRVINRMSKDIYSIDEQIPATVGMYLRCLIGTIATLTTICYVTPMFTIMLLPISAGYYSSQRYYIKTSRELQRLDSISRSPVYAHLTETIDGLTSIHAYGAIDRFNARYEKLLDLNQRAFFLNFASQCWLALRLEFSGTLIATGAAAFAVLNQGNPNPAFAGLAGVSLSYALSSTQTLNWSVRMLSQLQTQMVSVERIENYRKMPREAELHAPPHRAPPASWPTEGSIVFDHVSLRYRPDLPKVLKELTFSVKGGEKIGVVGRTGAGKSSLMTVLMRLVECDGGKVLIDGVDIGNIGLHDLRSKISIIPQEPVLFSGTVRSNVDPFNLYSDADIWHSLKRARLSDSIQFLEDVVAERGANFSVGERQLICIARSLLRNSKIIMMDEATASIDVQTDQMIQQSIREEFEACTCLTIAHRMNTVMDSDRVLVMDNGQLAEFDSPSELLKNPNGIFTSLVNEWRRGMQSS